MLNTHPKESEKAGSIDPQICLAEVDRLVRSPSLSGSEALCKLLQFLAQHTLNSPEDHLKEYEIATQVFGRPADFDPQADSGVRVQMGRLRSKLAEHYQTVGAADPIQVEVPKGAYSLSFRQRVVTSTTDPLQLSTPAPSSIPARNGMRLTLLVGAAALICVLAAAGVLIAVSHRSPSSSDTAGNQAALAAPPSLRTFWGPFSRAHRSRLLSSAMHSSLEILLQGCGITILQKTLAIKSRNTTPELGK